MYTRLRRYSGLSHHPNNSLNGISHHPNNSLNGISHHPNNSLNGISHHPNNSLNGLSHHPHNCRNYHLNNGHLILQHKHFRSPLLNLISKNRTMLSHLKTYLLQRGLYSFIRKRVPPQKNCFLKCCLHLLCTIIS